MSSHGVREPDFGHRCRPARLPADLVIRARHDDESQREASPRACRAQSPAWVAKGGSRQSSRNEYPDAHSPDSRADRVMAPSFPRVL